MRAVRGRIGPNPVRPQIISQLARHYATAEESILSFRRRCAGYPSSLPSGSGPIEASDAEPA